MIALVRAAWLGWAVFSHVASYDVGVIERAAVLNHQRPAACMVASLDAPLGAWLRVKSLTTGRTLVCKVVDQVAPHDRARHRRSQVLIEVGAANLWAMCGQHYVGQEPSRACSVVYRRIP